MLNIKLKLFEEMLYFFFKSVVLFLYSSAEGDFVITKLPSVFPLKIKSKGPKKIINNCPKQPLFRFHYPKYI